MNSNLDKYKSDLSALDKLGAKMNLDLAFNCQKVTGSTSKNKLGEYKKVEGAFRNEYQRWYTEAFAVIQQIIPNRLVEFENLYKGDGKRKEIQETKYYIQDWLQGFYSSVNSFTRQPLFNDSGIVLHLFNMQLGILKSALECKKNENQECIYRKFFTLALP